ncbi:unnamed protein product [Adineta steineri]|uniref:RWD domain-containing protein n=1 Tax=Adineta steineri TaxID=433720 RepID=A0A819JV90_9BILA|nr:unnamed protein product [Adineta steineri]CAF3935616.1 unnamed protein product [Adineta steineri]
MDKEEYVYDINIFQILTQEHNDEELNVLISIYLQDLIINYDNPISLNITIDSNGDENDLDRDKPLLCITFIAELPSTYPHLNSPKITLCCLRGLTDEQINELIFLIYSCLELNIGFYVLYECIESIRSKLSVYELPQKACTIYFALINSVCRRILANNVNEQLPLSSVEQDSNEEHQELIENLAPHIKQWQERTHALFQQQKEKGGIIDLDKSQDMIFS